MNVTIDVPDLPDGWSVIGYVYPQNGQMYLDSAYKWCVWDRGDQKIAFITAYREQTAADWANEQQQLGLLAKMLYDGERLCLSDIGQHEFAHFSIRAEECPRKYNDCFIEVKSGKWTDSK